MTDLNIESDEAYTVWPSICLNRLSEKFKTNPGSFHSMRNIRLNLIFFVVSVLLFSCSEQDRVLAPLLQELRIGILPWRRLAMFLVCFQSVGG